MSGSRPSLWRSLAFASWLAFWHGASARAQPELRRVPMPDGVTLATEVWRRDDTPRPALLRRTPYGRALDVNFAAEQIADGYVLVSQDVRGRGDSGGRFLPFATDEADGRATIDWIAAQPWSNGKVGMWSSSAEGIVQYQAMAAAPRALACTSIRMATHDLYSGMFPGGAWRTELDTAWLESIGAADAIGVWRAHEVRDAFWDALTLSRDEMARVRHPVRIVGGMFDIFAPDQARIARELPRHARDVTVVLGPWTHGGLGSAAQGQLRYPEDAALPQLDDEERAFFAWCLKGAQKPQLAPVRYYLSELGDTKDHDGNLAVQGEWREAERWPPAAVTTQTLFVAADHRLAPQPAITAREELPLDPADPLPTRGGANFSVAAGPFDQAAIDRRRDVYLATSAPLERELELVGTPRAFVWAASASDDVDVVVRFEQVTAGGKVIAFADGIRRGRFVRGDDAIRPLTPGAPTLFEVELGPVALRVRAGASLRVAISGASSPRYEPNPHRALALSAAPPAVPTMLTIYSGREYPSRIELPVLQRSTLGTYRWALAAVPALVLALLLRRLRRET